MLLLICCWLSPPKALLFQGSCNPLPGEWFADLSAFTLSGDQMSDQIAGQWHFHFLWRTPIGAGSNCSPAKDPARWLQSCGKPTTCSREPQKVIVKSYIYIICVLNWFICICLSQSAHPALFRSFDPLPTLPNQSKTVEIPGNASDGDTNVFRKHAESHFQNDLQATNCPPTRSRLRSCQ